MDLNVILIYKKKYLALENFLDDSVKTQTYNITVKIKLSL